MRRCRGRRATSICWWWTRPRAVRPPLPRRLACASRHSRGFSVPTHATGATLPSVRISLTEEIDVSYERYPVIKQLPDYDFTILVKGDSMEPEIKSGDELACRVVTDASFIQWGKVHVLDTDQGIVVKRIYDDKDGLKCVSDNPKYLPFTVPKDQLRSVCLVVGLVRF